MTLARLQRRAWCPGHSAPGGEAGSVAVEAAVLAPALVALLLLVVLAGRVAQADGDVQRAASAAARAASLQQFPAGATTAARQAAVTNLAGSVACADLVADVDTRAFGAGGTVVVTLTCTASLRDVSLLGVPGKRTFVAHSAQPIDRFRGGEQ
ncbi:MAG: TadE/TadG family type IV pilus assembly protein [Acidimicrobiales bacterium]